MRKTITLLVFGVIFSISNSNAQIQCAQSSNIYTFTYNGHTYEVVKELKTLNQANICAAERGGYLVRINDLVENSYIVTQLMLPTAANIAYNYHPVADGGGASYIWTGANDIPTEGSWIWSDGTSSIFYSGQGTAGTGGGTAVGGAYVNWGNVSGSEPDDYGNDQDGLGISLGSWPHGIVGQWNDIDVDNTLFFVIEKNSIVGVNEIKKSEPTINIYPNPLNNQSIFKIEVTDNKISEIKINDILNREILSEKIENKSSHELNLHFLPKGIYIITIEKMKTVFSKKFLVSNL